MYIAKRFFETSKKAYKKGETVPAEVAVKFNSKFVELVEGAKVETIKEEVIVETVQVAEVVETKPKKGKKVKEEILVEEPTEVEVTEE